MFITHSFCNTFYVLLEAHETCEDGTGVLMTTRHPRDDFLATISIRAGGDRCHLSCFSHFIYTDPPVDPTPERKAILITDWLWMLAKLNHLELATCGCPVLVRTETLATTCTRKKRSSS